jgi:hypothetical protein
MAVRRCEAVVSTVVESAILNKIPTAAMTARTVTIRVNMGRLLLLPE